MIRRPGLLNPVLGHLDYLQARLRADYPDAKINTDLSYRPKAPEEVIAFYADCDAVIMGGEKIDEGFFQALPHIRTFANYGVGLNHLDIEAAIRHKINLVYETGVNKLSVAELAVGFMLNGLRWVTPLNLAMRAGERPSGKVGWTLTGRVVGLHGFGEISKEVARLLAPFDCEIIVHDIADHGDAYARLGAKPVDFETLLRRSEVLSIHIPLTRDTANLYDAEVLAKLREDCVLVNTSRGGIVDEDALADRLEAEKLMAACFDVFAIEPAVNDRLIQNRRMLATPHTGASTVHARLNTMEAVIRGFKNPQPIDPKRFGYMQL